MEYLVVIEKAKNNYAAYSPDVPGCIATGKNPEETMEAYVKALKMHIDGLKEDGLPIPKPITRAEYVAVP
jgi:predicted RNase H-like HicB family nuclease